MINQILQGNCLDKLKELDDNSVDSIVTDPPYELGFMGKSWDSTGIANNKEMWAECLRVLKPGGHLLAFSGTRTYHRMAVAIEDAGFEVRDMIEWVYGSGFPKSLNIAKQLESGAHHPLAKTKVKKTDVDEVNGTEAQPDSEWGNNEYGGDNGKCPKCGKWYISGSPCVCPKIKVEYTNPDAKQWEGWGTALKPAHEPICMARKPLAEKSVAENCLKWGTGGINIDESRVGTEGGGTHCDNRDAEGNCLGHNNAGKSTSGETIHAKETGEVTGRFPANLIHDNSEEVRECFPETKSGKMGKQHTRHTDGSPNGIYGKFDINHELGETYGDSGNASRFFKSIKKPYVYSGKEYEVEGFVKNCKPQAPSNYNDEGSPARYFKSIIYQAKASKSERNKGCEGLPLGEPPASARSKPAEGRENALGNPRHNNHPTVKPIALMEYLIKMVTPKGGIVLDPFAGSGSTLVAAKQNGFDYIGIELAEEYIPTIEARLEAANPQQTLI